MLNALQQLTEQHLQRLLQPLFDNADDAFFELANRAENNSEQNHFFEAMREVRVQRKALTQQTLQQIRAGFLTLTEGLPDGTAVKADSGSLSLVSNNELEERVALESMVAKALTRYEQPLLELTTRLDVLVTDAVVTEVVNPLGPECLCQSFLEACEPLGIGIRAKLVLFKLYERYVIGALDSLYEQANKLLLERGILPGLNRLAQRRPADREARQSAADAAPSVADSGNVFADLQSWLQTASAGPAPASQQAGLVGSGQAPAIPRNQLLQLLQYIQQEQAPAYAAQQQRAAQGAAPGKADVAALLNQALTSKLPQQSLSLGQLDGDVINLVEMLFQFILDERNLAAPMKALLARLQIPFIKAAMLDRQFFSKNGHPARQLLNTIASACLGWEPVAALERDPLYKKVDEVVAVVVQDFETDTGLFQKLLDDFVAFRAAEERRAKLVEQRTLSAAEGKARAEQARQAVASCLDGVLTTAAIPVSLRDIIKDGWGQVLFHAHLQGGDDSAPWRQAEQTLQALLASLRPVTEEQARQQLSRRGPQLVEAIEQALRAINYNSFESQRLLDAVKRGQRSALRRPAQTDSAAQPQRQPVAAKTDSAKSGSAKTLDQLLAKRQRPGDAHQTLAQLDAELAGVLGDVDDVLDDEPVVTEAAPAPAAAEVEAVAQALAQAETEATVAEQPQNPLLEGLTMGSWFELQQDHGRCRCRLAAVIRSSGRYIFVSRSGIKVAEYSTEEMARALQCGDIRRLDDGQLFDRALASVIGDLRAKRSKLA